MIDPISPDFLNTPVAPTRPRYAYAPADHAAPPVVTIITPFYNVGSIFHETAQSVFQQSLQQWEWVIVNDGSNDSESLAILDSYRACDPRVRVIDHDANKGLSAARNTGFRTARTPLVVQLDGDDLLEPTTVEKWVWFLVSYPEYAFVKGYSIGFAAQEYLWEKGFHHPDLFKVENQTCNTSIMRVAVHQEVGEHDETIRGGLEDWDFWLRCAVHGYWGTTIPEYLDWYRRRPSHRTTWDTWDGGEREQAFVATLRQRYPQLWVSGMPIITVRPDTPYDPVPNEVPFNNKLQCEKPRVLLLLCWQPANTVEAQEQQLLNLLIEQGYEVTVVTATARSNPSWLATLTQQTPDVFILEHFLRKADYPRFLRYLIQSRQIAVVLLGAGHFSYACVSYLRAHCPKIILIDCFYTNHVQADVYSTAVHAAPDLNLTLAASAHIQRQLLDHGSAAEHVVVYDLSSEHQQFACLLDQAQQLVPAHHQNEFTRSKLHSLAWLWWPVQGERWQRDLERQTQRVDEKQARIEELERDKAWHMEQAANWRAEAEAATKAWREQQAWNVELEHGKAWLQDQVAHWCAQAQSYEAVATERQRYIATLEQAVLWHQRRTADHASAPMTRRSLSGRTLTLLRRMRLRGQRLVADVNVIRWQIAPRISRKLHGLLQRQFAPQINRRAAQRHHRSADTQPEDRVS